MSVLFDSTQAQAKVKVKVSEYVGKAKQAAEALSVPEDTKAILTGIVDILVPEGEASHDTAIFSESASIALT